MRLPNVKFAPTGVPTISEMVGMAAQAVGDGLCHTCLVIYPTGNLEGRYRRGGENADDYARGARQWTAPWGNHGGNDFINIFPHNQYCLKYGGKHDDLAPFVVNQHRNGLLTPWGYNATHNVPQLTIEDYVNSRYILNPLRLWDCDRPVNASAAYLFTTAERARDMRQTPVYVLNHSQHNFRKRSTQEDLDEIEDWTDRAAKRMYEGAGLGPEDVDIFNPYDGYAPMAQFFLEAFQWHGVKRGDAFAFYAGDIRVEGPHPFCSSGGNLGTGRLPHRHVHRQHRAAPRHRRRTPGQGSGRDRAGGLHHAQQWRLDHVRQIPELTACDTGARLRSLDARRHVGVVLDRSLRTVDAKHYVELAPRYRQPIGHRDARRQLPGHVNRERAVLRVSLTSPIRPAVPRFSPSK